MSLQIPCLIVHGGAGPRHPEREVAARAGCLRAWRTGQEALNRGSSALDAVEAAVVALEDDPIFNAGTGAVLNRDGEARLDASIMSGEDLRAGAVAHIARIRNPVSLARTILDDGRHVLMVDAGAEAFAEAIGHPLLASNAELVTARQRQRWQSAHGTVGAVARDTRGRLAAATSTGGRLHARPGRVGDSPLIGCGTYADALAACSCTGIGEDIIRTVLAKHAVDRRRAGQNSASAAKGALEHFADNTNSEAGLILIGADGAPAFAHNAGSMAVAYTADDGTGRTEI